MRDRSATASRIITKTHELVRNLAVDKFDAAQEIVQSIRLLCDEFDAAIDTHKEKSNQ